MRNIEQIPQLPVRTEKHWQQYLIDSLLAVGGALAVTGIIYAYHLYPTIPNISIVYLLVILLLASTRGRYATALITSQLTIVARQSVEQARLREREARILYETGRVINSTDRLDEQLDSIALALVRVFSPWGVRECALLLLNEDGTLSIQADAPIRIERFTLSPEEMMAVRDVIIQGKMIEISKASSASQSTSATSRQNLILRLIPLKAGNQILGVLGLRIEHGVSWFASLQRMQEELEQPTDQSTFFWTFLDQAILTIEQARLRARAISNNE